MIKSLNPEILKKNIDSVRYHHFDGTTVVICLLTLKNGFTVIGEAACANPDTFKEEIGKRVAYENAFSKLWGVLGAVLKDRQSKGLDFEEEANV